MVITRVWRLETGEREAGGSLESCHVRRGTDQYNNNITPAPDITTHPQRKHGTVQTLIRGLNPGTNLEVVSQ